MERNYKLYVHIAPNGKKYYGITKQRPEQRWLNGKGYSNQYFTRAINKYGWGNIEHIVLYDDLTEDEAKELEQYMIQWYDTANPNYGYNITLGGESGSGYSIYKPKKRTKIQAKLENIIDTFIESNICFNHNDLKIAYYATDRKHLTKAEVQGIINKFSQSIIDTKPILKVRVNKETRKQYDIPNKYSSNTFVYIIRKFY